MDNGLVAIPFFLLFGACNPGFGYILVSIEKIAAKKVFAFSGEKRDNPFVAEI